MLRNITSDNMVTVPCI